MDYGALTAAAAAIGQQELLELEVPMADLQGFMIND